MNNTSYLKNLICSLCRVNGVSGDEADAADFVKEELSKYAQTYIDPLGNVRGHIKGKNGPHILLDAHIDQIGFIVTRICDDGFLKVAPCGGMDLRIMSAQTVTIFGDKEYFGVIASTPPHLQKDKSDNALSADEIVIDTGLSGEEAKKHISPGDRVILNAKQFMLNDDVLVSPALDDRAGVAVILETLRILKEKGTECEISVLFSVQEESTGAGARVGAYSANADEAIAVDVSFAKTPGISDEKSGKLGYGAMIGIAPSVNFNMFKELKRIASEKEIPYQLEVMGSRTGTNVESIMIAREGVKCALVSIPLRYMHTGIETISVSDVMSCARLIAEYISERAEMND